MAVTSNWSWGAINRQNEINISNGVHFNRLNWNLTRYRISNDTYSSDLGDTESSLSGYNGDVTETIAAPSQTVRSVRFSGTVGNWTLTTTNWIETGYTINQSNVYTPYYSVANIPNASMRNAAFLWQDTAGDYYWVVSEFSPEDVANGNLLRTAAVADIDDVYPNCARGSSSVSQGSSISLFGTYKGTFGNTSATPSITSFTAGIFTCTSDIQSYNQPYVDWFMQTQVWQYKSNWYVE